MKLVVDFKKPLPDSEVADKIGQIAILINEGYSQGIDMPYETNWRLELSKSKKRIINP